MSTKNNRAKRARRGDRSFQPSAAGKGDGDRTTDIEAYRANYDAINWGPGKRPKFRPIIYIREKAAASDKHPLKWNFDWSQDV